MTRFQRFANWLIARTLLRAPDFIIGGLEGPYLRRWWIFPRNPLLNVYLHQVVRSDDDRALHCHPWPNASIILRGAYTERVPLRQEQANGFDYIPGHYVDLPRPTGAVVLRLPHWRHRLILEEGGECWSLFITGPLMRRWGFWCKHGWVHWKDFVDARDKGSVGRGCA